MSELIESSVHCLKQEMADCRESSMEIDGESDDTLLMLRDFWLSFCAQMKSVSDAYMYLERSYLAGPQNMSDTDQE